MSESGWAGCSSITIGGRREMDNINRIFGHYGLVFSYASHSLGLNSSMIFAFTQ
jgi:hypothetical protein